MRATKALQDSRGLSFEKSKGAVDWLMHRISNPSEPSIKMGTHYAHVRYIHMARKGCFGFCGEKIPNFGPNELYDDKRMGLLGTAKGGFGGGGHDIALLGVMYWGHNQKGKNHINLAYEYGVPAIFLHQKSPWRNQPRPAEWGFYKPSNMK